MPRLNAKGQALCGVGAGTVSVDGAAIGVQGGGPASWLDDQTILVNSPALGPWNVVSVPAAGGAPALVLEGGANVLAAGGGRWLAWRASDGLHGSLGNLPAAACRGAGLDGTLGFCPSYASGVGLVLAAPDGTQMSIPDAVVLDDYALQVIGPGQAVWFGNGAVHVVGVAPPQLAAPAQKIRRCVTGDGELWWVYVTGDRLVAQPQGGTAGYVLSTGGVAFDFDAVVVNGQIVVAWSVTQGEAPGDLRKVTVDRTKPRVPLAPPPPIGPTTAPRPIDGQFYHIPDFLSTDPTLQPRNGPSHFQYQTQPDANGLFFLIKFGDIIPTGRSYEMYWLEKGGGYRQGEDASGSTPVHLTDTRWWPERMQIGEAFAFVTGQHLSVWDERDPCRETHRDPMNRKMWLRDVWSGFDWGPDLGIRATCALVYDPTAGFETPGRFVEVGYYAVGAGWCRWEAYHAELVYPNGPHGGAVFPASARSDQKDFYLVGGALLTPELTGCVPLVMPTAPAWPGAPVPPKPPEEPKMMYVDISQPLIDGVEGDRVTNDNGTVSVKTAQGYLSVDSGGQLHYAPAIGPDEQFVDTNGVLVSINTFAGTKIKLLPYREK